MFMAQFNTRVVPALNDPSQFDSTGGIIYDSYSGIDIVAELVLPNEAPLVLGELQTISYSLHRENTPVRFVGHVSPVGFVKGPRTIAGSMIFTVFNMYAFYRLQQYQQAITRGLYPLADMMPPVDVVLTFSNESGSISKMKIWGMTIVDEGGTFSIDDLLSESTFTWMARSITPLVKFLPTEIDLSGGTVPEKFLKHNISQF